jgi:ankyrin repeat protein
MIFTYVPPSLEQYLSLALTCRWWQQAMHTDSVWRSIYQFWFDQQTRRCAQQLQRCASSWRSHVRHLVADLANRLPRALLDQQPRSWFEYAINHHALVSLQWSCEHDLPAMLDFDAIARQVPTACFVPLATMTCQWPATHQQHWQVEHLAAHCNSSRVLESLLEQRQHGSKCSSATKPSHTIKPNQHDGGAAVAPAAVSTLHIAAGFDSLQALQVLLMAKADAFALDPMHRTPLHYAARNGACRTANALIPLYAAAGKLALPDCMSYSSLHMAAQMGHVELIRSLLAVDDALATLTDLNDWNALHHAVFHQQPEALELLARSMPHTGTATSQWSTTSYTPLHLAAETNNIDAVRILLRHLHSGEALAATTPDGWSAVHFAAYSNHHQLLTLLLEHAHSLGTVQSLVNCGPPVTWTPLMAAARHGHHDTCVILLRHGADAQVLEWNSGWSAMQYADAEQHHDTVQLLRRYGRNDGTLSTTSSVGIST